MNTSSKILKRFARMSKKIFALLNYARTNRLTAWQAAVLVLVLAITYGLVLWVKHNETA